MCADVRLGTYQARRQERPVVAPDTRRRFIDPLTGEVVLRATLSSSWHPTMISLVANASAPAIALAFEAQDGQGAIIRYRTGERGAQAADAAAYLDALVEEQAGPGATYAGDLAAPVSVPDDLAARLAPARIGPRPDLTSGCLARSYEVDVAGVRYRVALVACVWSLTHTSAVPAQAASALTQAFGTDGLVAGAGRRLQDALFGQHTETSLFDKARARYRPATAPAPAAAQTSEWGDEGLYVLAAPTEAFEELFGGAFAQFCQTVSPDERLALMAAGLGGNGTGSTGGFAAAAHRPSPAPATPASTPATPSAAPAAQAWPDAETFAREQPTPARQAPEQVAMPQQQGGFGGFGGETPAGGGTWQTPETFGGTGGQSAGSDWSDLLG